MYGYRLNEGVELPEGSNHHFPTPADTIVNENVEFKEGTLAWTYHAHFLAWVHGWRVVRWLNLQDKLIFKIWVELGVRPDDARMILDGDDRMYYGDPRWVPTWRK